MQTSLPAPGAFVWIRERRWRVDRARREGLVVRLDVSREARQSTFLTPFDRITEILCRTRPIRRRRQHVRAILGQLIARSHSARTIAALATARIAILPYQLEPALAMAAGARRVLIADDVGLGKTVQAGLVLAEMLRRRPAARALIVAPRNLREQWADELAYRFGIQPAIIDRASLDRLSRDSAYADDPWSGVGVSIASMDFLKQPHVFDALPVIPWDLLIIDEAHAVAGISDRHDAADRLGRRARRLLLLSATPHSGDEAQYSRLAALGATPRPADTLTIFRRTRDDVGETRRRRVSWHRVRLGGRETELLDTLRAYERATLTAADPGRRESAFVLLSVFRKRALSSGAAVSRTLRRRLAFIEEGTAPAESEWIQPSLGFDAADAEADDLGHDERLVLGTDTGLARHDERGWLARLVELADAAARTESKIRTLIALVERANDRAVIFTEFRASLEAIAGMAPAAWRAAILHGGLTDAERRDALGRFADGESRVLIATDVAGQGLNLQHAARWVVNLELPWNPARLEQRLGRIDRIGQRRPAHLSLLVARHDAEDGLLAHLARRTLAARRALGPDVLGAAAPDEARLAAALIGGEPVQAPPTPEGRVDLCLRWQRAARAMAQVVERQRRFAGVWPARLFPGAPVYARGGAIPGTPQAGQSPHAVLVFEASIVDAAGTVLETGPVAVRVPGLRGIRDLRDRRAADLIAIAERAVRRRLEPRLRRLARIRRELAAIEAGIIDALRTASASDLSPGEGQPGLFDRREHRQLERSARRQARLLDHLAPSRTADGPPLIARPILRIALFPDR